MSFVFRDPFFDGFDDLVSANWPFNYTLCDSKANDGKKNEELSEIKKRRRDIITPFSGFGRMDMHESEKSYDMKMDIPGMEKKDIKISMDNNKLVVEGERKHESHDSKKGKYHFMERHYGSFHREMSLPVNADGSNISATYDNGVLMVSIPKLETASTKKMINVE